MNYTHPTYQQPLRPLSWAHRARRMGRLWALGERPVKPRLLDTAKLPDIVRKIAA